MILVYNHQLLYLVWDGLTFVWLEYTLRRSSIAMMVNFDHVIIDTCKYVMGWYVTVVKV